MPLCCVCSLAPQVLLLSWVSPRQLLNFAFLIGRQMIFPFVLVFLPPGLSSTQGELFQDQCNLSVLNGFNTLSVNSIENYPRYLLGKSKQATNINITQTPNTKSVFCGIHTLNYFMVEQGHSLSFFQLFFSAHQQHYRKNLIPFLSHSHLSLRSLRFLKGHLHLLNHLHIENIASVHLYSGVPQIPEKQSFFSLIKTYTGGVSQVLARHQLLHL